MRQQVALRRTVLRRLTTGVAAALAAGVGLTLRAQSTPRRLRILCGAPAGGTPDVIARIYAESLSRHYADGVLVENRPGAGAQIGIAALKHSTPDGASMLLAHGAVTTVYPKIYTKLAYDPVLDLTPVSLAGETAFAIGVGPLVPERVRELEQFILWARGHASDCSYGTPGIGTLPHLLGATLFRDSKVDAQHVVYSGGLMAVSDVLAGRLAAVVLPEGLLRAYRDAGRLRILATSGERRSRFTPDAPTLAEQGHPTVFKHEWFGFFMPRDVPPAIVEQTSQSIQLASGTPQVLQALDELAIEASASRPAAMEQRIAAERRHWEHQIAKLGLRLE